MSSATRRWHRAARFVAAGAAGCVLALCPATQAAPVSPVDRDADGLDDVWEAVHGSALAPTADLDGDGFDARAESLAGTDPRDARSAPTLLSLTWPAPDVARLRWPTVVGKYYTLHASPDFVTWHEIATPVVGDGTERTVDVPLATSFTTGGVPLARWTGVDWFDALKSRAASGSPAPDFTARLDTLDAPRVPPREPEIAYGQWVRGWIVPPASGVTTFWLSSDDYAEFWLSTDASPANKSRRIYYQGATTPGNWTASSTQRSAPVTLQAHRAYYFEAWHIDWGWGDHLQIGWTGAAAGGTTTPQVITTPHLSRTGVSLASLAAGGRLFFRIEVTDTDTDADGVTDYAETIAGLDPTVATSTPRQPDLTALLTALDSPSTVTVGASPARAYEAAFAGAAAGTGQPARFTFFRSGGLSPLTIPYTITGTATSGSDFTPFSGTITLPAGVNQHTLDLVPLLDALVEPPETVTLTLGADTAYTLGTPASATATIDDAPDILYVATLRGVTDSGSGGSGIASVRITGNELSARAALSFGNLRAPELGADLYVSATGAPGSPAAPVFAFATGQVAATPWAVAPAAGLTREQILAALREGRLWARVASTLFPDGELRGRLVPTPGWETMPPPPAAPSAPTTPASDAAAARFLIQTTFGPTAASIARVRALGYAGWVAEQLAQPASLHLPYVQTRRAQLLAASGGDSDGWQTPRNEAWWQHAVTAPDQLRQRMAWALSQILVISQVGALDIEHEGTAAYYDLLVTHAFGNYRDLLEDVTLSPMMGTYLSMIRNRRPDPETGHQPDENYARESKQLFSIGLTALHPDGTHRLGPDGLPLPTYTQADTVGLAHIFTGWGAHFDPANPPRFWWNNQIATADEWFLWGWDPLRPMTFNATFHDPEPRTIVGGVTIPAGLSGPERLARALDVLFQHPNTGPFLARQLIQRFVTSNPSPGYVYRVASVFANNGAGVRGDLGATLRAVVLDPEALRPESAADYAFGKPAEPVLRLTRLYRAYPFTPLYAGSGDSRLFLNLQYEIPEQAPLLSPSVFNFFQPAYTPPGLLATAGLAAPEFQITNETTVITAANSLFGTIHWGRWTGIPDADNLQLNLAEPLALLQAPGRTAAQAQADLLDHLNTRLLAGRMSPQLRARITSAFAALPSWYGYATDAQRNRVRMALYLITVSPDYAVQR